MTEPNKPESIALRSFAILEAVVRAGHPVSLDEVTETSGLPKPTAFRILAMLQEGGLLRREPLSKRYIVGTRLSAFALDVLQQSSLRGEWHRILQELVDEIGESCNLTTLDAGEVLYLDRVETPLPLRLHLEPGTRVPLHCTASGKLFLSQMSPKQLYRVLGRQPLKAYTPRTITDPDALEKELKKVRATQVGLHDSELFDDSAALAVPVVDATGKYYAAIAVHAPASRMSIEAGMRYLPALRRAAHAVSLTIGSGLPDAAEGGGAPGKAGRSRAAAGKRAAAAAGSASDPATAAATPARPKAGRGGRPRRNTAAGMR